jgi:hypothetical protein
MSEPTIADLAKLIEGLTGQLTAMQANIDTLKSDKASASGASGTGSGSDGRHHTDRPPRLQKMDFPRYDGKSDPLIFINRCESYFHQQRIMEEEKVWMASYNLEDKAQLWYIQVQEDEGTPTWRRFKDLLNLRYGPPLRSAPLFELAECRRTGSVEAYQDRFQALLPRAGQLTEGQRVQLFTGGLLPPLSNQVRLHNPQTLAVAMSLAREVEVMERERLAPVPTAAPTRAVFRAPPTAGQPPLALPAPPVRPTLPAPPSGAVPARLEGPPIKRLSTEEQAERRRLGLCYNCNEKYSRGHNRVCRRIFFVDGVTITDEEEAAAAVEPNSDAAAPLFSLQAVAGVPICDTMQVKVDLGAATLVDWPSSLALD